MPLKQAHVADALGLSVEHVNRALAALRREGIATLQKGRLGILDRRRLEALAGWDGAEVTGGLAPRMRVG